MDVPIQSKRILVVEDNPEMRQSVVNTLELERYQVDQAENGQAALALLQRVTPDLIVSDINMPRMNGIEFYRALRQKLNDQGIETVDASTLPRLDLGAGVSLTVLADRDTGSVLRLEWGKFSLVMAPALDLAGRRGEARDP